MGSIRQCLASAGARVKSNLRCHQDISGPGLRDKIKNAQQYLENMRTGIKRIIQPATEDATGWLLSPDRQWVSPSPSSHWNVFSCLQAGQCPFISGDSGAGNLLWTLLGPGALTMAPLFSLLPCAHCFQYQPAQLCVQVATAKPPPRYEDLFIWAVLCPGEAWHLDGP